MAPIPYSKETSPISGEEDEASIFVRVMRHNHESDWFVIKGGDDSSSKFPPPRDQRALDPVFHQDSKVPLYSAVAAVGSTIYLVGGKLNDSWSPCSRDVYYIDTEKIDLGWKKSRFSMNRPVCLFSYAFTVKSKVYVIGGNQDGGPTNSVQHYEVFDPQEGWRELKDLPVRGSAVTGHAVLDGGARILVHCDLKPLLYCYDVGADSWCVYNSIPHLEILKSVCIDNVLYFVKPGEPGVMCGLDVSKPYNLPKQVILGSPGKCDWDWIPQPYGDNGMDTLPPYLVSLGGGKLAAVWSQMWICCSRIKMCKEINKVTGQVDYVAYPLSFSVHKVQPAALTDCLAVFLKRTSGAQEDVSKDDNVVTADNKNNNRCGRNMLANDRNRRTKNKNKLGKSEVA